MTVLPIAARSASAAISPTIRTGRVPSFDFFGSILPAFLTPPSTRAAANAFAHPGQKAPYTFSLAFVRPSALNAILLSAGNKAMATTRCFFMVDTPFTIEWTTTPHHASILRCQIVESTTFCGLQVLQLGPCILHGRIHGDAGFTRLKLCCKSHLLLDAPQLKP